MVAIRVYTLTYTHACGYLALVFSENKNSDSQKNNHSSNNNIYIYITGHLIART